MHQQHHLRSRIISAIVSALISISSVGLTSDNQQLAHFASNSASYNYEKHIAIFIGNVMMTKGSTKLTADKVTVYRNAQGIIEKMIAVGKLAHYQTLPNNSQYPLHASAHVIEYYPTTGVSILINDATIQQGKNQVHSQRIVYNREQQLMQTFPDNDTRTKIVFDPSDPPKLTNTTDEQAT